MAILEAQRDSCPQAQGLCRFGGHARDSPEQQLAARISQWGSCPFVPPPNQAKEDYQAETALA